MATLTVKSKPSADTTTSRNATRAPVRRADPAKRDRSITAAKKSRPTISESTRQRNHRHDGSLRDTVANPAPITDEVILRSDYPARDRKAPPANRNSNRADGQAAPKSAHTNTRAMADREGAYRNPPRRGGKAKDGFVASEFDKHRAPNKPHVSREQGDATQSRLSKRMAELGLCSRREADEWIVNGWVKVNGVIVDQLGSRVPADAEIVISAYATEYQAENVTILLHKPVGYVSGQAEDGYEPAIVLIHPDNQWSDDPDLHQAHPRQFQRGFLKGLAPAGRLDIDSTGLLVLTQDGRIARHLIGENSSVEKEYLVRVEGSLSDADLMKLNFGLSLDGVKLKPAKVSWQNEHQLRFVLREGKKRQIRRMCELVGLKVVGLKRIRIGSVTLGKLPPGQWRYLGQHERF